MNLNPTSKEFFEEKYRASHDPWAFGSSDYELNRYASMLTALSHRRYRRAFEPGCSIGVFTSCMAKICDEVIATDISETAALYAKDRCMQFGNVTILCRKLPEYVPSAPLDLVVLSEVGYYLEVEVLCSLAIQIAQILSVGGVLLATHWLGHSEDHLIDGEEVHSVLRNTDGLALEYEERHSSFLLDRWVRR